jgi:O-acetylhomoserine/O-acetylserine sulfhydrylase-like pyridoxal-dependent enzyme
MKCHEHAAKRFAVKEFGNFCTRIMNPAAGVFEQPMAAPDLSLLNLTIA